MIYTYKIQQAIHFAIAVHEEPVKQKRKGKDIPYITHPLTVGLILSQAGASEDVVVAGILHDTIEDCEPYGSVTRKMIAEKFGEHVAELVDSVTEKDKSLSWHERKEKALEEIRQFSHESLLVKSGDVLSNATELIADYKIDGDATFARFNAPKEELVAHTLHVIRTIVMAWGESPLANELCSAARTLQSGIGIPFIATHSAAIMSTKDFNDASEVTCPVCGWTGNAKDNTEYYDAAVADVFCPICDKMVLVISYGH